MFEYDKEYINSSIKAQDYSFIMDLYSIQSELESFFDELESEEKALQDKKIISNLSYYYINIDLIINSLTAIINKVKQAKLKNSLPFIGFSIPVLFFNPLISLGMLGVGSIYLHNRYHQLSKQLDELNKYFSNSSEKLAKYSNIVADYKTRYESKKGLESFSYSEVLALISSVSPENRRQYFNKLKAIFNEYKTDKWQLYLRLKQFKDSIYEESHEHTPDYYFLIENLISFFISSPELNTRLIQETLYYIDALPNVITTNNENNYYHEPITNQDKENYYFQLANAVIDKIKNNLLNALEQNPNLDIKNFIIQELAKVPETYNYYLQGALDKLLKDNESYEKYKLSKANSQYEVIIYGLIIYIKENKNLTRSLTTPK